MSLSNKESMISDVYACKVSCLSSAQSCTGCMDHCQSACQKSCQNCQSTCQKACQNCQGVACQSCQSACQKSCQSACQKGCQSTCELSCQNCQGVACQSCQDTCQKSCQSACQKGCQSTCQQACQSTCEKACQSTCQKSCQNCEGAACENCQTTCEKACQNCQGVACQSCQSTCEKACQSCQGVACQSCQSTCQKACQNCQGVACQSCQSTCEKACQIGCMLCQFACENSCQNSCETGNLSTIPTESDRHHLGILSAQYESGDDAGRVSSGNGDPGGVSYGAYQFSSNAGSLEEFMNWLEKIDLNIYNHLNNAMISDGNTYGANFKNTWKSIAKNEYEYFYSLQHQFTKNKYYDKTVNALSTKFNFNVNNYSLVLKNVVWSRSVQHGAGGVMKVLEEAFKTLDYKSASEKELIIAIYKESGLLVDYKTKNNPIIIEVKNKKSDYYNKCMKYFSACSPSIQISVWKRLNENELGKALEMLTN